ncbi:MAG: isopentenyl-diphosphate Delta-isomerase [Cyclobacteriaceae bacterium]
MMDQLILVDEKDQPTGFGEKLEVHQKGLLHRAFSIFVINSQGDLLLQKRADNKYHSGGLWANTCCSHPIKGEGQETTVLRRLNEEMGFTCPIKPLFSFVYKTTLDNDLTEYEYDHVYLGHFDGSPSPNPNEVADWKWVSLADLKTDLAQNPKKYVFWLSEAFPKFEVEISNL